MRFLPELGRKAAGDTPASPTAWGLAPGQHLGPYRTVWDVERAVRQGVERVTWVFRAMDVIASNAIKPPAVALKGDKHKGTVVPTHEVANLLNSYTNPAEMAAIFRYRLSMQLQLSKKGAFVEIQRDKLGRIIGLYLLPPEHTYPVPDPKTFIRGFEVRIPGLEVAELPPERVCWVRTKPHPTRPYEQLTWIEASGIAIDTDWLLHVYNRNFVRNDKRPGLILAVSGGMDNDEAADLKTRVESHQGGLEIIDADQAKLVDMALTARDFQFIEAGKATKEEIQMGSGVPEGMMGNTSGRTYANASVEKDTFWEEVMLSHLGMTFGCLDQIDGDPTTFLVPDITGLSVLMQDKIVAEQHMLEEVNAGTVAREEYRDKTGKTPSGVPAMAEYFIPATLVSIGTPSATPAAAQKVACTCSSRDEEGNRVAGIPGPLGHKQWCPVAVEQVKIEAEVITARKMAERPLDPHDPMVRAELKRARVSQLVTDEKMMTRELKRHFARERRVVLAKIEGAKSAPAADKLFDVEKWRKQLAEDMTPVLEELYTTWGNRTISQFSKTARATQTKADGEGDAFDVHDPGVTERITSQVNRLVGVEDTTYADIQDALADGEAAGESIPQLAARIRDVFDAASASRSETIARTEVLSAANGASVEAAAQDGTVSQKEWLATPDDRTREAHAEADGQQVGMDEGFEVGGETLEYPGDPAGSPENVVNCRCTTVFV